MVRIWPAVALGIESREQSGERFQGTLWQQWASDWVRSRREIWALRDAQISSLKGWGDVLAPGPESRQYGAHWEEKITSSWTWYVGGGEQVTRRDHSLSNQERLKFKRDVRGPGGCGFRTHPPGQVRCPPRIPTGGAAPRGSGQLPNNNDVNCAPVSPLPWTTNSRRQAPRVRSAFHPPRPDGE